jgi:hypothetical protein
VIRGDAILALGQIGDPSVIQTLAQIKVSDPKPHVKKLAGQVSELLRLMQQGLTERAFARIAMDMLRKSEDELQMEYYKAYDLWSNALDRESRNKWGAEVRRLDKLLEKRDVEEWGTYKKLYPNLSLVEVYKKMKDKKVIASWGEVGFGMHSFRPEDILNPYYGKVWPSKEEPEAWFWGVYNMETAHAIGVGTERDFKDAQRKVEEVMSEVSKKDVTGQKKSELEMGIEVEKEHADTIKKVKEDPSIPDEVIFKMISQDHLSELKDYYTRLKKMEEGTCAKAVGDALNELGVPGPGYPAPFANAVDILKKVESKKEKKKCPTCKGEGEVKNPRWIGPDPYGTMECPTCKGTGESK